MRGLTLKELADKVKTTPQTIQRLETGNMTVSLRWLERIAKALNLEAAQLVSSVRRTEIAIIGKVAADGNVLELSPADQRFMLFALPMGELVAVKVQETVGPYQAGSLVCGNKYRESDVIAAHGQDCMAQIEGGHTLLCRVIAGSPECWTLIPHASDADVLYNRKVAWLARVCMVVRYC